jgi:general secretion pathway protein A
MNKKLLALYGLKFNPFCPDLPTEALFVAPKVDPFLWRVESLVPEGGFVLCTGDPGTGKSVVLRLLSERLSRCRDLTLCSLTRPQSGCADFYRELGERFGVLLSPHNRWAGSKVLRERWQLHIETQLLRPVLLIDEAQEMLPSVLTELRLLYSAELDSRSLLPVVLAGDNRLLDKFRSDDLMPLASRIRVRLLTEPASPALLAECLRHLLTQAGNPHLFTEPLICAVCEHALGNYRVLMNLCNELLAVAVLRELPQLDEKLYLEVFSPPPPKGRPRIPPKSPSR